MNLGFGSYNFSVLVAIKAIAFRTLENYTVAEIVDVGVKVIRLVERFKEQHPDKVVVQAISGGLLGDGSSFKAQLNDFEIAQQLLDTNNPAIHELAKGATGLPVLMAYLSVITSGKELPPAPLLESALPFAVASLSVESAAAKVWNQSLQTAIARLAPLASKGLKFQGKKEGAVGPLTAAVRKRLKNYPRENAADIWSALSSKPPKGLIFCDNRAGKYVEYDKRTHAGDLKNTGYRRFANIVTDEKKRLKILTV